MKKLTALWLIAASLAIVLIGCGGGKSEVAGKWSYDFKLPFTETDEFEVDGNTMEVALHIDSNGTLEIQEDGKFTDHGKGVITYVVAGKKIPIEIEIINSGKWMIDGKKLIFISEKVTGPTKVKADGTAFVDDDFSAKVIYAFENTIGSTMPNELREEIEGMKYHDLIPTGVADVNEIVANQDGTLILKSEELKEKLVYKKLDLESMNTFYSFASLKEHRPVVATLLWLTIYFVGFGFVGIYVHFMYEDFPFHTSKWITVSSTFLILLMTSDFWPIFIIGVFEVIFSFDGWHGTNYGLGVLEGFWSWGNFGERGFWALVAFLGITFICKLVRIVEQNRRRLLSLEHRLNYPDEKNPYELGDEDEEGDEDDKLKDE